MTSPRKSIAAMLFKHYLSQQQVDLKVKIGIPGSWFGAGNSKALTATGKKERYEAIAVEYEENHIFEQICSYLQLSTDTGSDS